VFGDDRVCGTRKQMMLQVDLVRHRARAWAIWGILLQIFVALMDFKDFVILLFLNLVFLVDIYNVEYSELLTL